jgi:hypothetical protein
MLDSVMVSEPSALVVVASIDTATLGDSDGSIVLSLSGGSPPYTFSWSTGATSQDLDSISEGEYIVTIEDSSGCLTVDTFMVPYVLTTLEIFESEKIVIYPNPTTGLITLANLQSGPVRIKISKVVGMLVYDKRDASDQINLSGYSRGIYYLRVELEELTTIKKIIKL